MTARPFAAIFGFDHDDMSVPITRVAVAAVRAGYAVVPVTPGGKKPLCTLTARDLKRADVEAQGEGLRMHRCATRHAITDPDEARRVFSRLEKIHDDQLNLGIVAHPSRIITVDCDTLEELEGFVKDAATATGDDSWLTRTPTTRSPGEQDPQGNWIHKDGGHFHYDVPAAVVLPEYPGEIVGDSGWVAKWSWTQALVPPSKRDTGRYTTGADVLEAPAWLMERIQARIDRHREHASRPAVVDDSIAAWSVGQPWAELLLEDGWADAAALDGCGCPIFTRPGDDVSNRKSATAHSDDCPIWENREGHGPLHLWTDNAPVELEVLGRRTLTKLEYVAATRYDGDFGLARATLGIEDQGSDWFEALPERGVADPADTRPVPPTLPSLGEGTSEPDGGDEILMSIAKDYGLTEPAQLLRLQRDVNDYRRREIIRNYVEQARHSGSLRSWMPDADFVEKFCGDVDEPPPSVLTRTDGKALFYRGRVNNLSGRRGAGKTWLAILATISVLEAGGRVAYIDMEDTRAAWKARFGELGFDITTHVREGRAVWVKPGDIPVGQMSALVDYLAAFDLVTFDVLNRLITRLGGNPDVGNKETMQLTDTLFDPLAQRGSCVLVLDHPNKKGQRADATVNDLDPGGGVLKMNNLSGMSLGMLPLKRFTRDNPAGQIDLFCLKDRPGHYEELALIGHMVGSMDINERGLGLSLEITPPDETELVIDTHDRDVQAAVDRITEILTKRGAMSRRDVKNSITTRLRKCFDEAVVRMKYDLETLTEEGRTLRLHVPPSKT